MDTHGATPAVVTEDHGHSVPESGERFEKPELEFFVTDDRGAGKNIGVMLAIFFAISFTLFASVSTWMITNSSTSHDPQAGIGADVAAEHH